MSLCGATSPFGCRVVEGPLAPYEWTLRHTLLADDVHTGCAQSPTIERPAYTGTGRCWCALGGPSRAHARVGDAFRRAPRSPALTVEPVGVPARLPSGFPSSTARATARRESAGRSGRRVMPQHTRRLLMSAPCPHGTEIRSGVGRVARRARLAAKPYSRSLPRLTLKAGRKEGLPTTPISRPVCGAIPRRHSDLSPFFKLHPQLGILLLCIYILGIHIRNDSG